MRLRSLFVFLYILICTFHVSSSAQETVRFKEERAEEDYSLLQDSTKLSWMDAIKHISLNNSKNYLSIGGSYRPRFEYFTNRNWIADEGEYYYSQRLSFHTDWQLGKHFRLFGELYNYEKNISLRSQQ